MNVAYIDLDKDSPALVACLIDLSNETKVLETIVNICSKRDKKNIFIWSDKNNAINYLENIRKRNLFCWFYLIYGILDNIEIEYDYKILIKRDLLPVAELAMRTYQEKNPDVRSKSYDL